MPKQDHAAQEGHHHEYEEPLLYGQGLFPLFNDGKRTRNDVKWAVAYLIVVALTVAWGVALFFFGSPDFLKQVSPDHLADPASCPVDQPSLRRRGLLAEPEQKGATLTALFAHPFSTIGCTLAGSGFLGFLFLVGFHHQASAMIALALGLQLGTTALLAVGLGVAGNMMGAGFVGGYFLLLVWLYWLWKDQITLVGRLLSIAGHALVENSGLLGIGLAMPVVWGLTLIPTAAFGVIAVTNGQVVPNPNSVGLRHGGDGSPQCVDDQGGPVMCCTWEVDALAKAYLGLLGLAFTWTTLLLSQIKLFAVAGAVAQWYFTPAAPALANPRRSRVLFSLGHALGPSFGSLCAASALLTLISYLRQALDVAEQQARKENQAVAIIAAIVAAILRFILSLVEFMTRFTTVRMAITGEPFIPAAKASVSLFKRNAMNAFGVWWLPPFILGNCMLVLSAVFGVLVWGSASLIYRPADNDISAVVMGATAGVVALVVLSFLQGLLMDVVETVFVCFAMDRDTHNVTRHEVHVILTEVPNVGQVVEQPDGNIAYGAPASGPGRV